MSTSLSFSTGAFSLISASLISPSVVRVRFSYDPSALDADTSTDGLNPDNYSVTGPANLMPVSVSTVASDPQALDVNLAAPPTAGLWTITASLDIEDIDGDNLTAPNSYSFSVAALVSPTTGSPGTTSYDDEDIIRRHLPPTFVGKGWDALISALASGDRTNRENGEKAFNQLFLSSADGSYLRLRAGDQGISDPSDVGMSDGTFREYAIRLSNKKLTQQSILEILEVFYGEDSLKAHFNTALEAPFVLVDGSDLQVLTDQNKLVEVVFDRADFNQIGAASAYEVAAVISRAFLNAGVNGKAVAFTDPETNGSKVAIYSNTLGLMSSVTVTGGAAQARLQFPTLINAGIEAGSEWSVTIPSPGVAKYSLLGDTDPLFLSLEAGQYAVINGTVFNAANRGSFEITEVSVSWNGSSYTQYFLIENPDAVAQAGPLELLLDEDVLLFSPKRASVLDLGTRAIQVAANGDGFVITIPATAEAVSRTTDTAAYLLENDHLDATAVRQSNGTLLVTTTDSHGLAAGDSVQVLGMRARSVAPATLAGTNGSSGAQGSSAASHLTIWSGIRTFDDITADIVGHTVTAVDDETAVLIGGYDGGYSDAVSIMSIEDGAALTSGVARGQTQKLYNYTAGEVKPVASALHSATEINGSILVVGGLADGSVSSQAHLYNHIDDNWTAVTPNEFTARWGHTATKINNSSGESIVFLSGGLTESGPSGAAEMYHPSTGIQNYESGEVRAGHSACAVSSTEALVCGGYEDTVEDVIDSSIQFSGTTETFSNKGRMAFARSNFGLVQVSDGVAVAIGGYGRNLSRESANRALRECEIYSSQTGRWSPMPGLPEARQYPKCFVINNQIYVTGGLDGDGVALTSTVRFDISANKWFRGVASGAFVGEFAIVGDVVVGHGDGAAPPDSPPDLILSDSFESVEGWD